MVRLKSICYRGGIACFDIPASWEEEYMPEGGAIFYEDRADSGTLRLNVLSFSNGKETGTEVVEGLIAKSGYTSLSDGLAIKQYLMPEEEDGEQLQLNCWEVAIPVEFFSVRMAIFTYTILASQANDRRVCQEIELLDRCIRAGQFSREQGISGEYQHE